MCNLIQIPKLKIASIQFVCRGADQTHMLSSVTFRMSMTSHFPEVSTVTFACVSGSNRNVWAGNMSQNNISRYMSADETYVEDMVDVLVAVAVTHQQVEGVGVCVDNWLWRGELKPQ